MVRSFFFVFFLCFCLACCEEDFDRDPGYAVGYLSNCPRSEEPAIVTESYLNKYMPITALKRLPSGKIYKKRHEYNVAAKYLSEDPNFDFNQKTALWITGWVDKGDYIISQTTAGSLLKRNFNVIIIETHFFARFVYPVSSRLVPVVGNVTANFLSKINTLDPKNLYLFGLSLGGQTVGFIGKYYEQFTGTKVGQIFSIDPAGPCFRFRPPSLRLAPSDAEFVQVLHTNTEIMGMAIPMGDIDWYANGGEFQFGVLPHVPCLGPCSHVSALLLANSMILHEKKFFGVRCKNVQQARESKCYENSPMVWNVMSLSKIDRTKRGIYYLPTLNQWPFYMDKEQLTNRYDQVQDMLERLNADETLVLDEEFLENADKIFSFFDS